MITHTGHVTYLTNTHIIVETQLHDCQKENKYYYNSDNCNSDSNGDADPSSLDCFLPQLLCLPISPGIICILCLYVGVTCYYPNNMSNYADNWTNLMSWYYIRKSVGSNVCILPWKLKVCMPVAERAREEELGGLS